MRTDTFGGSSARGEKISRASCGGILAAAAAFAASTRVFQDDPLWGDIILFYEYFQGDNGTGLGVSHQTGWADVIALLMQMFATSTA